MYIDVNGQDEEQEPLVVILDDPGAIPDSGLNVEVVFRSLSTFSVIAQALITSAQAACESAILNPRMNKH